MLDGNSIYSKFECKFRLWRTELLKMAVGTAPESLFPHRDNCLIFDSCPSSYGMVPSS